MLSTTENVAKSSPILDRKIEEATAGLSASFAKQLHSICENNAAVIIEYIAAMKSEVNLSDHYRKDLIELLCRFSKYSDNKPFKDMIRTNITTFLKFFAGQKHKIQCTNGLAHTTFSGYIYSDSSSGSITLILNQTKDPNLQ